MQKRPYSGTRHRTGGLPLSAVEGERSAVRPKSGESVSQSDPGLRRPTPPSTAGRKPVARPPVQHLPATGSKDEPRSREPGGAQRKTGRSARQSLAIQSRREAPDSFTSSVQTDSALPYVLEDSHIAAFIKFFQTLDRWDREAHGPQVM
jgi:hypothetical protein